LSYIAVDIGATNIRVATGNSNGIEERKEEFTDKKNGPNGVSVQIIRMIKEMADKPRAIGI
jgi:predicted NBD/HSP70 family sugar kinase